MPGTEILALYRAREHVLHHPAEKRRLAVVLSAREYREALDVRKVALLEPHEGTGVGAVPTIFEVLDDDSDILCPHL